MSQESRQERCVHSCHPYLWLRTISNGLPDGLYSGVGIGDSGLHEDVPEALQGVASFRVSAQKEIA